MISNRLLALVRCPDCAGDLAGTVAGLTCRHCGRVCAAVNSQYLDLRPSQAFDEQTRYLDHALHADARHETVSPPLLSAAIRHDVMRAFLALRPGDRLIDLGCGSGRALVWNQAPGVHLVGVDVSPFFAVEALDRVDLALGDLRGLPFPDGSFTTACSLDVLEHLSLDGLRTVLGEASRVLAPGGRMFVYTHVRKTSPLAAGTRAVNRVAHRLERLGLIDLSRERLRKSDHLNPLADHGALREVVAAAGFRIDRIRYYTPLVGTFIENVLVRMAETALARLARRRTGDAHARGAARDAVEADPAAPARAARARGKHWVARRGLVYAVLRLLTWMMKLDLVLFGRFPSGPFFALLVRDDRTPAPVHAMTDGGPARTDG